MNTPETIGGVFKSRLNELVRGTQGTALAITIAFVMPVYLLAIGIYGISEVIRNKIELQNAADAACYSAAVVQADYLSKFAVINKAMAWTYVDMQKRSLDLAMDLYTKFVFFKFNEDFKMCKRNNLPCHMHTPGFNYNCGTDIFVEDMLLLFSGFSAGFPLVAKEFNGQNFATRFLLIQAFHNIAAEVKKKGSLTNAPKVAKYGSALIKMMKKQKELKESYEKKIKDTALQMVKANIQSTSKDYYVNVKFSGPDKILLRLPLQDEEKFISFADPELKSFKPKDVFGPGTDKWIVSGTKLFPGFIRIYKQTKTHLNAKWDWFWTRWVHISAGLIQLHLPPFMGGGYDHGHRVYQGKDIGIIKENLPIGLVQCPAMPLTLSASYFGRDGSISVAIVRKSPNPLARFSGSATGMRAPGIWGAFNASQAGGHRPEYLCAIATARAGFVNHRTTTSKDSLDYRLDYSYESDAKKAWNLVETDWDAVMVPVRHAWNNCAYKFFVGSNTILKDIMLDKENWVDSEGKKVESTQLPDWEKLAPPAGLICKDSGERKLKWDKLQNYLGH